MHCNAGRSRDSDEVNRIIWVFRPVLLPKLLLCLLLRHRLLQKLFLLNLLPRLLLKLLSLKLLLFQLLLLKPPLMLQLLPHDPRRHS